MPLGAQFLGRWRFQASVLAPVVVSLLLTAATVLAFVLWATGDLDERSMQREVRLAEHILSEQTKAIPHDQQSVVIWDDAVQKAKLTFDFDWVDNNLGSWMYEFFGHNRSFVLNDHDQPIYAMSQGYSVNHGIFDADDRVYRPLIARLRERIASGALDSYTAGTSEDYPQVVEITTIADSPAIVSVSPIATDSGDLLQPPGTEYLYISVVFLDRVFAHRLADDYLLTDANFTHQPNRKAANAVFPVLSSTGRIVGFFEWTPEHPGQRMLARTGPVLAGGFVFAILLVSLLLYRLWHSSSALEAGRLAAQHQANHDALTGLANRARFDEILGRMMMGARPIDQGVALLMLDLDRFKQVNDTLGHQSGAL